MTDFIQLLLTITFIKMKKTISFLGILALLSACTGAKQKLDSNGQQAGDKTTAEAITQNFSGIDYTQFPLAYLVEGELYFHSLDDNKSVKFIEEPDGIFNFVFDTEGETLYYSVERDSTLWLKSADISTSKITPKWVVDWELKKDECITETFGEESPLRYHKGELLMEHGFNWGFYAFRKFDIYSITSKEKKSMEMDSDWHFCEKFEVELSREKEEQYFKTTKQQLYYIRDNAKACLTDKLNFEVLKGEGDDRTETEFHYFTFSPDETKILFGVLIGWGDLPHGPYCIANVDGSNQMMLEGTDIAVIKKPAWLKNNSLAFRDNESNLFVTNNEDNSFHKIAENVSSCVGR